MKKLIELIEGMEITSNPMETWDNNNGTVTETYRDSVEFEGETYIFFQDWTGKKDGKDEGVWSTPYDIEKKE
jgi:hypothetical protein